MLFSCKKQESSQPSNNPTTTTNPTPTEQSTPINYNDLVNNGKDNGKWKYMIDNKDGTYSDYHTPDCNTILTIEYTTLPIYIIHGIELLTLYQLYGFSTFPSSKGYLYPCDTTFSVGAYKISNDTIFTYGLNETLQQITDTTTCKVEFFNKNKMVVHNVKDPYKDKYTYFPR